MTSSRDTLYADPHNQPQPFCFDERVASVFPDMIQRSVPGYSTIIAMTGLLAGKYATAGSHLYDLGCSLGASTLAMRAHIEAPDCLLIGVDNSAAMLERAQMLIDADTHQTPVSLICSDLQDIHIENASVVILNFTLQFVPLAQRDTLLSRLFEGLNPGGILVLSEKVTFADSQVDQLNIELHHQFKRANGYSELEVAQKRSALEQVLLPETLQQHKARMAQAGFDSCDVWFQCFNFASLIALK